MDFQHFYFYVFVVTVAISMLDTPCTRRKATETAQCGGDIGCFIVSCEADGSFSPKQCDDSTGIEIWNRMYL